MRSIFYPNHTKAFQSGISMRNVVKRTNNALHHIFCISSKHRHMKRLVKKYVAHCKNVQDFAQNPYTTEQFVQNSPLKASNIPKPTTKPAVCLHPCKHYGNPPPTPNTHQYKITVSKKLQNLPTKTTVTHQNLSTKCTLRKAPFQNGNTSTKLSLAVHIAHKRTAYPSLPTLFDNICTTNHHKRAF